MQIYNLEKQQAAFVANIFLLRVTRKISGSILEETKIFYPKNRSLALLELALFCHSTFIYLAVE